ncbi:hypothetical protein P8H26_10990 [Pseudochrobactrum sp. sp1633]|uniref:hypothetical protein n=1 Tax=Pseudochrobactrum sp. sp1633 TaxID=3036706 RepID=UPI0025A5F363|nr:hypothetical protein [Pseudochrobactrum sp. sp1633]MDM8345920.1 hypothetical protein [Pseudochrobactrum sp. sp1633]
MNSDNEILQSADHDVLQPYITLADLESSWIGVGAAIDWIAMRGKSMTLNEYYEREDKAAEAFVEILSSILPLQAEKNVRGLDESNPGPLISIPSGIWPQTATSDSNDRGKLYRLIGTDDHNEWDGAILSSRVSGYRMVQVRSDFIRDNWPENRGELIVPPIRRAVSQANLRRIVEMIVHETPKELVPLTQREVNELVSLFIPSAQRDNIRRICKELIPLPKPGPRGQRNPNRKTLIQELGEKLISAQLPN